MSASSLLPIRFQLNTFISGPQAWFFVAAERGYFRDAGLEVSFLPGDTAANTVPRLEAGDAEMGYGDLNALIERAGHAPATAPVAVMVLHGASPYTIAAAANGPIRKPADLAGARLVAHPNDAALRMFPEFAGATGLPADLPVTIDARHHRELVREVVDTPGMGLFGFVNTLASAAIEAGIDPAQLHHLEWRHHVPDLAGAAIMARPDFVARHPEAVAGFVTAVNRALIEVIADPEAGIDAMMRLSPQADRAANLARLTGTLALEMAHGDNARLGIGDVDPGRLARAIALIAAVKALPSRPEAARVFDRRFLPPLRQRAGFLAQTGG